MMKWLCALMVLVFSATVASAAHGSFMQPAAKAPAIGNTIFADAGEDATRITAPCCQDTLAKSGSATPCSADCSFLPASCDMNIADPRTGHGGTESPLPEWLAGKAQFRPPII